MRSRPKFAALIAIHTLTFAVLLCVVSGLAAALAPNDSQSEQELRKTNQEMGKALQRKDTAYFNRFLADTHIKNFPPISVFARAQRLLQWGRQTAARACMPGHIGPSTSRLA